LVYLLKYLLFYLKAGLEVRQVEKIGIKEILTPMIPK